MEEAFVKLIEFVEAASPMIWATARQQVKVEIFMSAFWAGVWAALTMLAVALSYIAYRQISEEPPDEDSWGRRDRKAGDDFWMWLCGLSFFCAVLAGILAMFNLVSVVQMNMNPNYYAIEALLKLFNGGG